MQANALEYIFSSKPTQPEVVSISSTSYIQLVSEVMKFEWRYPHHSNISKPDNDFKLFCKSIGTSLV